jgi:hypothetical protein
LQGVKFCCFFQRFSLLSSFQAFLEYNKVADVKNGKSFETTLLGSLLSVGCIVKNEMGPYEFFDKPSAQPAQEHNALEARIWEVCSWLVYHLPFADCSSFVVTH